MPDTAPPRLLRSPWFERGTEAAAWLGFFICLRWTFGLFEYGELESSHLFNSDGLFPAALWRDLRAGGHLGDWNFPHATYVPDLVAWLLVDLLAPSVPWAVLLFGVLQVTLVAAVTRWLLVREFGARAGLLAPAAWATVLFFIARHRIPEALDAFKPVHHFSVGIAGLLMVPLCARALGPGRWGSRAALTAFLFLLTFSDPFGVSTVWAPAVLMLCLVLVRDPEDRRGRVGFLVGLVAAGLFGHWLLSWLTHQSGGMSSFRPEALGRQWEAFKLALSSLRFDLVDMLGVLGVASFVPLFIRGLRRLAVPAEGALLDLLPLSAAVINQAMLFATANVELSPVQKDPFMLNRYVIVIFVYLVVTLARLVAPLTARRGGSLVMVVATAAVLLEGAAMAQVSSRPLRFSFPDYQPMGTRCLDSIDYELNRGLAGFWVARPTSLINRRGLQLNQLDYWGAPNAWLTSRAAFQPGLPSFNFVVMNDLDPDSVRELFGPASQEFRCPGMTVWWYAPEPAARLTKLVNSLALSPRP